MKFLKKLVSGCKERKKKQMSEEAVKKAYNWLHEADAILVTASNGLSISEGLNLFANDQKLKDVLGDLVDKYHLPNLLTALNFPYKSKLDHWRAIARVVEYYGNNYEISSYMSDLKEMIGDKPYFIWISNIDHHFSLAGFKNVFEIEGNWFEGICSRHPKEHGLSRLGSKLHDIYEKDRAGTLTEADIPRCDKCGAELDLNIAGNNFQVNQNAVVALQNFLEKDEDSKLLLLELGIGPNNQLIKAPSMQLIAAAPNSHYITINQGQLYIPDQIAPRSIGFSSSIAAAFKELTTGQSFGAKTEGPRRPKPPTRLTPEQAKEEEQRLQKFFPCYMVDQGFQPGTLPMYLTLDQKHPSCLHTAQYGQAFMYDMGDAALVHCFTQEGQYYQVRLGLDKSKKEVHSFYADPGTFVAIEDIPGETGFSLINTEIPTNGGSGLLVPKKESLLKLFPKQRAIINRLSYV